MVFWECTQPHGGMVAGVTIFFKVRYMWFIGGRMIVTRLCLHVMVFGDCGSSNQITCQPYPNQTKLSSFAVYARVDYH